MADSENERLDWITKIKTAKIASFPEFKVDGQLFVEIVQGKDLIAKNFTGKSDPYCFLMLENQTFQTSIKLKTLNPLWNESFTFDVALGRGCLYLCLWDWEKFNDHNFMGLVKVPLKDLEDQEMHGNWYDLEARKAKEKVQGQIYLRIQYTFKIRQGDTPKKVFGVPLHLAPKDPISGVPYIVQNSIDYLRNELDTEGIFLVTGMVVKIAELKLRIDQGENIDFSTCKDCHVVTCILKAFLRELPDPLLTFDLYDNFLEAQSITDENKRIAKFKTLIKALPPDNVNLLKPLLQFISIVAEHSAKNKMPITNLALIFAPAMLRTQLPTMEAVFQVGLINATGATLLTHHQAIFNDVQISPSNLDIFRVTYLKDHVDDEVIVDDREVVTNGKQEVY